MRDNSRNRACLAVILAAHLFACCAHSAPRPVHVVGSSLVELGWHPMYQLAADPENSSNLIVCGSKWDAARHALYGFVSVSRDGGKTWRMALEDRHSQWLNDSSCAFDAKHAAFFLAPAAKVIDDAKHLELGNTRLYLSADSGEHWTKECKTTWLDYSASAVSAGTHFLVAFFNDGGTYDEARAQGSSVAALYFIPGQKNLLGPILDPGMRQREYQGAFPSNAVGVGKSKVAALYFGGRKTSGGMEYDLGVVRFDAGPKPSVSSTVITAEKRCLTLDGSSLAYDPQKNLLLAVYAGQTPGGCRLMLATSTDLGDSWDKQPIENAPSIPAFGMDHLSLAFDPRGVLGVLWEDSGSWFFSTVEQDTFTQTPINLGPGPADHQLLNDSIMTVTTQSGETHLDGGTPPESVELNVRALPAVVWRSRGLVFSGDEFHAILPVIVGMQDGLRSITISVAATGSSGKIAAETQYQAGSDVTPDVALLPGQSVSFNKATGVLSVDVRLANRGYDPIVVPIFLRAVRVQSSVAKVTILNADNRRNGPGAIWDASPAVTGCKLLPSTATYKSIRLLFRLEFTNGRPPTENLLNLGLKVLAVPSPDKTVSGCLSR